MNYFPDGCRGIIMRNGVSNKDLRRLGRLGELMGVRESGGPRWR